MDQEQIRIFISSPSDVQPERERVERVIEKLDTELGDQVRLSAIRSEDLYYTATKDFQAQIPLASKTDLVIVIIWKRMGTPLPPDRYHRQDGTPYASGTEFEFEEARDGAIDNDGTPQIWMYRKTAKVTFEAEDVESERAQWVAVNDFWKKWFHSEAGHLTAAFQEFSNPDELEAQIEQHLRHWLADRRGSRVAWPEERGSPFRGLEPFGEAHADVFFGRKQVVEQSRARLVNAALRHCPFILLIGMSGSGKSSVVRAGVIPRLRKPGAAPQVDLWRFCVLRPSELGQDLVAGLAGALHGAEVLPELADGDYRDAAALATLFRTSPPGAAVPICSALDRAAQRAGAAGDYQRPLSACVLLVVDQLEEIFARPDAEHEAFAQLLSVLVRSERVWVVSTIRSDFYPQYQGLSPLLRLKEDGAQFDLMPPGPAEVREIIGGPARAAGLEFEVRKDDGRTLAAILEEEAGQQPGMLPLLEFTLDELYKARDPLTHTLTFAAYQALGGLTGAIRMRADAVFDALPPNAQAAFDAVFRALVRVTADGASSARRTAQYNRLADDANAKAFVDAFLQPDARLLVADRDAGGEPTVSIAHESMLNAWPRLRDWLEHNRELLRSRARVAADAELWDGAGRGSENLAAQGKALDDVKLLSRSDSIDLSEAEQAYIDQSLRSEAERIREETRRRWAVRAIAAVVVALIVGVVWEGYTRYAEAKRSQARELANESSDQRDSDPPKSVRLARESYELDHSIGEPALRSSLDAHKEVKVATGEHANEVHSVTVGRTVLAGAFFGDGSRLWKPSSGEPVVLDDNEQAESIALDADDAIVVTAGEKGVRVWRDGGEEPPLISADEVVPGQLATVSRDGKRIAATSGNDVRVWTSADGSWKPASRHEDTLLVGHKVNGVDLSPDATLAVTAGADGTVSVWEIQTARTLVTLPGHEGGATDAVFGPDGKTVASSGRDHTARIWSARGAWSPTTWRMDMILGGHLGEVLKVAWSPGGRFVATASADNTAAIWEVNSGTQVARLRGHTEAVKSVAFTPDGSMVATGSADKTVRLWRTGAETFPLPHEASVRSARFNTDGSFVLTASKGQDTMARIWHAGSGELVALLRPKPGTLNEVALEDIAVAPGDRWIVGVGENGTVKVWDANTCEPVTEFKPPEGDARTLQFETQSTSTPGVLITIGARGQVRRWEVGTWKALGAAAPSNATLPSSSAPAASVAAAGDLVVTAVGNTAEVRDTRTPHADPVRLPGHLGPVLRVAFSPDGKMIATASGDKTVRLHRYAAFAPGEQLAKLADETFAIATTFWSAAPPSFHACPRPEPPR